MSLRLRRRRGESLSQLKIIHWRVPARPVFLYAGTKLVAGRSSSAAWGARRTQTHVAAKPDDWACPMKPRDIFPVWWGILRGRSPFLSIEITKECPLRCPGCYAFAPGHLGSGVRLKHLSDLRGKQLIETVIDTVRRRRPVHLSLVGGEPLVRYRELNEILPRLGPLGVEVQVVTSGVRPMPVDWASMPWVHMVVSVDGLPAEHNRRRAPATYDRILENISGQKLIIHCTVTRQMCRPGYLTEFCEFWSAREEAPNKWFSMKTPQQDEVSAERLTPADRSLVLEELARIRPDHPKLHMPNLVLNGMAQPPDSPSNCVFANITAGLSADLKSDVKPCQLGGRPVCSECGCAAAAGLTAFARYRLAGLLPLGGIFWRSRQLGLRLAHGNGRAAAAEAIQEENRDAREAAAPAGR